MFKMRLEICFALLATFALVATDHSPSRAMAASVCQSQSGKPGFNVGSQTRGSVVTLCGKFVQQKTDAFDKPKPAKPPRQTSPNPSRSKPSQPRPKPIDPRTAEKLLHRRLAMAGETSFTPVRLVILTDQQVAKPLQKIRANLNHALQYRTAYLLGRFVSLRFTAVRIDFHFERGVRSKVTKPARFEALVSYKTSGWHTIHGVVTYAAEYRLNGSKIWHKVEGNPKLAAVSARVLVRGDKDAAIEKPKLGAKPLLVANDCLQNSSWVGCLN